MKAQVAIGCLFWTGRAVPIFTCVTDAAEDAGAREVEAAGDPGRQLLVCTEQEGPRKPGLQLHWLVVLEQLPW